MNRIVTICDGECEERLIEALKRVDGLRFSKTIVLALAEILHPEKTLRQISFQTNILIIVDTDVLYNNQVLASRLINNLKFMISHYKSVTLMTSNKNLEDELVYSMNFMTIRDLYKWMNAEGCHEFKSNFLSCKMSVIEKKLIALDRDRLWSFKLLSHFCSEMNVLAINKQLKDIHIIR